MLNVSQALTPVTSPLAPTTTALQPAAHAIHIVWFPLSTRLCHLSLWDLALDAFNLAPRFFKRHQGMHTKLARKDLPWQPLCLSLPIFPLTTLWTSYVINLKFLKKIALPYYAPKTTRWAICSLPCLCFHEGMLGMYTVCQRPWYEAMWDIKASWSSTGDPGWTGGTSYTV